MTGAAERTPGAHVRLTGRTPVPAPRRLHLSRSAWSTLVRLSRIRLPSEFAPWMSPAASHPVTHYQPGSIIAALSGTPAPSAKTDETNGTDELVQAGVLEPADSPARHRVHRCVQANLELLCAPRVRIRVETALPQGNHLALIGLGDHLGAGVRPLADEGVEVSMFAAAAAMAEVTRLVPDLTATSTPRSLLTGQGTPTPQVRRIPWSVWETGVIEGTWSESSGHLRIDVMAVVPHQNEHQNDEAPPAVLGRMLWLAGDSGWLSMQALPAACPGQEAVIELAPVTPPDVATFLTPLIVEALDASSTPVPGAPS